MPSHLPMPSIVWPLSDRGLAPRLMDLATLPFVTGEHPYARQAFLGDLDAIDGLAPEGCEVERDLVQDSGDRQQIIRGDGWQAHLVLVRRRPEVQVLVTAETAAIADAVLDSIRSAAPPPPQTDAQSRLTLWTAGPGGSPTPPPGARPPGPAPPAGRRPRGAAPPAIAAGSMPPGGRRSTATTRPTCASHSAGSWRWTTGRAPAVASCSGTESRERARP